VYLLATIDNALLGGWSLGRSKKAESSSRGDARPHGSPSKPRGESSKGPSSSREKGRKREERREVMTPEAALQDYRRRVTAFLRGREQTLPEVLERFPVPEEVSLASRLYAVPRHLLCIIAAV
jgi:hypothetical protein